MQSQPSGRWPPRARRALVIGLRAAVTFGLMAFVVSRFGAREILASLGRVDARYFAAACALFLASQWLHAWRWGRLLAVHVPARPRDRELFELLMVGMFANFFLPSAVGGDLVRSELLRARIGARRSAYLSVVADRYLGFLAMLLIGIAAALVARLRLGWIDREVLVAAAFLALFFLALAGLLLGRWPERLAERLAGGRLGAAAAAAARLAGAARSYGRHPRTVGVVLAAAFAVQAVGTIGTVWVLAAGMGMEVAPLLHFVAVPLILVVTLLPVAINGIGLRDAAFALLYGRVDVPPDQAVALSVAWTGMAALLSLAGGLLLLRSGRWRRVSAAADAEAIEQNS